jgi:hypothetical protein
MINPQKRGYDEKEFHGFSAHAMGKTGQAPHKFCKKEGNQTKCRPYMGSPYSGSIGLRRNCGFGGDTQC